MARGSLVKIVLASLLLTCAAWCHAQAPFVNDQPRPRLKVPHCSKMPQVLADRHEAAWEDAVVIQSLALSPGAAAGAKAAPTQVRLLWDEQFLYVRFICIDDRLESPGAGRDENHHLGDVVEVFLDPAGDSRQYIELQVSPTNQVLDQLFVVSAEPAFAADLRFTREVYPSEVWMLREWDMHGLKTQTTTHDDDGTITWITDMAIPAEPLLKRCKAKKFAVGQEMRCNLLRYDWKGEIGTSSRVLVPMNWSPVLAGNPHSSPAAMGYITLIDKRDKD